MLTSKQRAYLRSLANGIDAIFQVGKNGVTPELRDTVHNALEARELVKISVLDNNMLGPAEAAEMLASRTGADIVQVIGNKFVLYRASKTKPVIEISRQREEKSCETKSLISETAKVLPSWAVPLTPFTMDIW